MGEQAFPAQEKSKKQNCGCRRRYKLGGRGKLSVCEFEAQFILLSHNVGDATNFAEVLLVSGPDSALHKGGFVEKLKKMSLEADQPVQIVPFSLGRASTRV